MFTANEPCQNSLASLWQGILLPKLESDSSIDFKNDLAGAMEKLARNYYLDDISREIIYRCALEQAQRMKQDQNTNAPTKQTLRMGIFDAKRQRVSPANKSSASLRARSAGPKSKKPRRS